MLAYINPNVGKSTLMNALVGEKLSIITSKAQTTRHRIMGIVNDENFQIVFSDTPGLLEPNYKMQEYMMKYVNTALQDSDLIIYVVEVNEKNYNEAIIEKIKTLPIILVINKIDRATAEQVTATQLYWEETLRHRETFYVSATKNRS